MSSGTNQGGRCSNCGALLPDTTGLASTEPPEICLKCRMKDVSRRVTDDLTYPLQQNYHCTCSQSGIREITRTDKIVQSTTITEADSDRENLLLVIVDENEGKIRLSERPEDLARFRTSEYSPNVLDEAIINIASAFPLKRRAQNT